MNHIYDAKIDNFNPLAARASCLLDATTASDNNGISLAVRS